MVDQLPTAMRKVLDRLNEEPPRAATHPCRPAAYGSKALCRVFGGSQPVGGCSARGSPGAARVARLGHWVDWPCCCSMSGVLIASHAG